MSSRALRKAQREREETERLRKLMEEEEAQNQEQDDEDDDNEIIPARPQKSAFAMLEEEDDEAEDDDTEVNDAAPRLQTAVRRDDAEDLSLSEPEVSASIPKPSSKRKKKKKKGKADAKQAQETAAHGKDDSVDDIDRALQSLATKDISKEPASTAAVDTNAADLCRLLAVDTQHLHAQNEMRRLFGRAALESHDEDGQQGGAGRRRGRGQQQAGLAAALGRRQGAQGGRGAGLGLLGLRRNIFVQGKEEWPVGTSGGLGMEIVEKRADGTIEYRFVHNTAYQDVQAQFESCVASMDPQRMVQLLQLSLIHI